MLFIYVSFPAQARASPIQDYASCVDRSTADDLADRIHHRAEMEELANHPTTSAAVIREALAKQPDTTKEEMARMRSCLEAIAAANAVADNPTLKAAVQGYYVAASSLLDAAGDNLEVRASADRAFDDAKNKLRAEAIAANKW